MEKRKTVEISKSTSTRSARTIAQSDLLARVRANEKRDLVDRLREIGLDQYVELPQIAVMGDTSSGKSSLLSALSGVSFPSSDQLTTRCPTQLILSRGDAFRGNVRLVRFQRHGLSSTVLSSLSTSTSSAGGVSDAVEGVDTSDLDAADGEQQQQQNQQQHQSPDREELLSMDDVPAAIEKLTRQLVGEGQYISDDQIVIEMCGPELPNLTLTDLPGLVRAVGDNEDQSIIPRVRQLVDRYMTQDRTIIIAVVPANVDMHNTEILQAAQEADPKGVRTIAVVTKLDLVDAGAETAVHELLLNKKKEMKLGYHAVKCRSQRDLNNGVSISRGISSERAFFEQHEYWHRLPQDIWGVEHLTMRLVAILQENILRSLPKVVQEIDARLEVVQSYLRSLGEVMDCSLKQRNQYSKWMNAYLRFMEAAIKGVYDLLPVNELNDDGSESSTSSEPIDIRLRAVLREKEVQFQHAIESIKTVRANNVVKNQSDTSIVLECTPHGIKCDVLPNEYIGESRWQVLQTPSYEELTRFIQVNRGDELAIFPSYRVFCNLFRRSVDQWRAPALELLQHYHTRTKLVSDRFSEELRAPPPIEQHVKSVAARVLAELATTAKEALDVLLEDECRPYTQDKRLFQEVDNRRQQALLSQLNALYPEAVANAGNRSTSVNLSEVFDRVTRLICANEDREARDMVISLQTYAEFAVRRFVDTVPIRLNDVMLMRFLRGMENKLADVSDEKLAKLMFESPLTAARRKQLVGELDCLQRAKVEIESLRCE